MYPSGSLYTSNYSNRTLGVGRSQQGHDIFSTKPGIVSIPPRLNFPSHLPKTIILTNYLISFFPYSFSFNYILKRLLFFSLFTIILTGSNRYRHWKLFRCLCFFRPTLSRHSQPCSGHHVQKRCLLLVQHVRSLFHVFHLHFRKKFVRRLDDGTRSNDLW